jgi:hypothetical protein
VQSRWSEWRASIENAALEQPKGQSSYTVRNKKKSAEGMPEAKQDTSNRIEPIGVSKENLGGLEFDQYSR